MSEIANAYLALYVKAPNIKRDVESLLGKADGQAAGQKLGDQLGKGITNRQAAIAGAIGGVAAQAANAAAGALGIQPGDPALIRRIRVGGAVEKQQWSLQRLIQIFSQN